MKDITGEISTGDFATFPQNLPVTFANVPVGVDYHYLKIKSFGQADGRGCTIPKVVQPVDVI
ncbi:hypothetical protein [Pelotomaculum schinkii]|uniref:hypothetical protein n=1 Tax=Pelotomaculum schinkii TaxID=78350 RepID=UPI00167C707F|nr:hypothetical protein [Pelotomaculum schinkii]